VRRRAGLTVRRLLLIEQPVVVLCAEHSACRETCRFFQANLPRCTADLIPAPDGDAKAFTAAVRNHLWALAGVTGPDGRPGRRRSWAQPAKGEWDVHSAARLVTRMSAWR
jgi:hypothetical protein